jgi:hypothetical protein
MPNVIFLHPYFVEYSTFSKYYYYYARRPYKKLKLKKHTVEPHKWISASCFITDFPILQKNVGMKLLSSNSFEQLVFQNTVQLSTE